MRGNGNIVDNKLVASAKIAPTETILLNDKLIQLSYYFNRSKGKECVRYHFNIGNLCSSYIAGNGASGSYK